VNYNERVAKKVRDILVNGGKTVTKRFSPGDKVRYSEALYYTFVQYIESDTYGNDCIVKSVGTDGERINTLLKSHLLVLDEPKFEVGKKYILVAPTYATNPHGYTVQEIQGDWVLTKFTSADGKFAGWRTLVAADRDKFKEVGC
jgi:hypothetical protein